MRINKLITEGQRIEYLLHNGVPYPELRGSGRSTILALGFIARAMQSHKVITVFDHTGNKLEDAARMLRLCLDIVNKLGLVHFKFNYVEGTLVYEGFTILEGDGYE